MNKIFESYISLFSELLQSTNENIRNYFINVNISKLLLTLNCYIKSVTLISNLWK